MIIKSQEEFNKYEFYYNNKHQINLFLNDIETYNTNAYYINNKIFTKSEYSSIKNIFEFQQYSGNYFSNLGNIKDEINKYNKDYDKIKKIEIEFEYKIDISSINSNNFVKKIIFENIETKFISKVSIIDSSSSSYNNIKLQILNCIFKSDILINRKISNLQFTDCIIYKEINITKDNTIGKNHSTNKFEGQINLNNTSFNKITFDEFAAESIRIHFSKDYEKNEKLNNNISFIRGNIEKINIYSDNLPDKNNIGELNFSNTKFLKDIEIFLNHLNINNLKFNSFSNLTDLFKINDVKVSNEFNITDADFGKVIFNGLNLSDAKLNFKHPTFNNAIFNNIVWNKDCEIINDNNNELRDIYRQMKFLLDKSGDSITGSKFYKNEMITQKKILAGDNYISNFNLCFWFSNSERLIFWFGNVVSNFGQSWIKPLLILFIVNFLLLILYYLEINNFNINVLSYLENDFWTKLGHFFRMYVSYLTPFRKLGEVSFFDILARITSALLIYQSAVAMRRKIER